VESMKVSKMKQIPVELKPGIEGDEGGLLEIPVENKDQKIEEPKRELEEKEKSASEYHDPVLRVAADFKNYERRVVG
jgi:molecular chaperone GrpE (heat shock protein)